MEIHAILRGELSPFPAVFLFKGIFSLVKQSETLAAGTLDASAGDASL